MNKFTSLCSIAVPLNRANIDTDAIIPKQFLKSIKRTGFGVNLFYQWRYLPDSEENIKKPNPQFVLNNPLYKNAKILLTRENFGCGSSREHAIWALADYGFRCIIAPSFAEIFYNNCFKNGILPIVQSNAIVDKLFAMNNKISVDLPTQTLQFKHKTYPFEIDPERKKRLINGMDDIAITLQYADKIKSFEDDYFKKYTWL